MEIIGNSYFVDGKIALDDVMFTEGCFIQGKDNVFWLYVSSIEAHAKLSHVQQSAVPWLLVQVSWDN